LSHHPPPQPPEESTFARRMAKAAPASLAVGTLAGALGSLAGMGGALVVGIDYATNDGGGRLEKSGVVSRACAFPPRRVVVLL